MSVKAMGRVWDVDVPLRDLVVLLALTDHADDEGANMYPSLPRVAWKVGASVDTVRRSIKRMVKVGILQEQKRPGKTSIYHMNWEACPLKKPFDPLQNDTPSKLQPLASHAKKSRGTPSKAMQGEPSITNHPTTTTAVVVIEEPERPTVFAEYERQFGMTLTAGIADTLKDMVKDYGEDWTRDALGITATSGKRGNLRYVAAILRNWQRDGKDTEPARGATVIVDEKTAWRASQKARANVLYDEAVDMLLPAFKDEDDRRRYITEYLNMTYAPRVQECAS
jgi:DnaD/phage-associated family protein